jgi:hypothetical protein
MSASTIHNLHTSTSLQSSLGTAIAGGIALTDANAIAEISAAQSWAYKNGERIFKTVKAAGRSAISAGGSGFARAKSAIGRHGILGAAFLCTSNGEFYAMQLTGKIPKWVTVEQNISAAAAFKNMEGYHPGWREALMKKSDPWSAEQRGKMMIGAAVLNRLFTESRISGPQFAKLMLQLEKNTTTPPTGSLPNTGLSHIPNVTNDQNARILCSGVVTGTPEPSGVSVSLQGYIHMGTSGWQPLKVKALTVIKKNTLPQSISSEPQDGFGTSVKFIPVGAHSTVIVTGGCSVGDGFGTVPATFSTEAIAPVTRPSKGKVADTETTLIFP